MHVCLGQSWWVWSLKPTDVPLQSQLLLYLVIVDFRVDLKAVIPIEKWYKFTHSECLALLQWAVKNKETVFVVCICHSLFSYAFGFDDTCYILVAVIVFLGLDLSFVAGQGAVLLCTHIIFIRVQLQNHWDMYCIVGFIRGPSHSMNFMNVTACVCMYVIYVEHVTWYIRITQWYCTYICTCLNMHLMPRENANIRHITGAYLFYNPQDFDIYH